MLLLRQPQNKNWSPLLHPELCNCLISKGGGNAVLPFTGVTITRRSASRHVTSLVNASFTWLSKSEVPKPHSISSARIVRFPACQMWSQSHPQTRACFLVLRTSNPCLSPASPSRSCMACVHSRSLLPRRFSPIQMSTSSTASTVDSTVTMSGRVSRRLLDHAPGAWPSAQEAERGELAAGGWGDR